jgi:hypothetical protein
VEKFEERITRRNQDCTILEEIINFCDEEDLEYSDVRFILSNKIRKDLETECVEVGLLKREKYLHNKLMFKNAR